MSVFKKILSVLSAIVVIICFSFNAGAFNTRQLELNSNRYTHYYETSSLVSQFTTDGFELVGNSDLLELWLSKSENTVRIRNKSTGFVWGSVGKKDDSGLNKNWYNFANSVLSIEYFDQKNNEKRIGISDPECKTQYTVEKNGFTCQAVFQTLNLEIKFAVRLCDDGLNFSVKSDDIVEHGENVFKSIYFAPFLGSVRGDTATGYMFIPDGCGALIHFQKPMKYLNGFDKRIYGKNYAVDVLEEANDLKTSRPNDFSMEEKQVMLPVYGCSNGIDSNAFLSVINSGAEYASIMATPAGVLTDYNWVTSRFDIRQKYLQPTQKSGGGIYVPQGEKNDFDCDMTVYFLSGEQANYSGMAQKYRSLLEKTVFSDCKERIDNNTPVRVDFLGADVKKQFLINGMQVFSTVTDVYDMTSELIDSGINNITEVLKGYYGKGLNAAKLNSAKLNAKIFSGKDYNRLYDLLTEQNSRLYLYGEPVVGNKTQLNVKTMAGNAVSKAFISVTYDDDSLMYDTDYYVKASQIPKNINVLSKTNVDHLSLALDSVGSKLYSDYTRNIGITRTDAMQQISAAVTKAKQDENIAIYGGNQYIAACADDLFDIPIVNSQFLFETDSIPFLQMVYKGFKDMYSEYLNIGDYNSSKLLRLIEYGEYPSFVITKASSVKLQDTPSANLFSTAFEDWKDRITNADQFVNDALSGFEGAFIVEHKVVQNGVVRVCYSNNSCIYINYNNSDIVCDGVTVSAESYTVRRR